VFLDGGAQVDAPAGLDLRSGRRVLWPANERVVLDLRRVVKEGRAPDEAPAALRPRRQHPSQERLGFSQQPLGANPGAALDRRRLLPGFDNHYLGNDSTQRTGMRASGNVAYHEAWKGVDAWLHGTRRHLEQGFGIEPSNA